MITVKEAALRLGVHTGTVHGYIKKLSLLPIKRVDAGGYTTFYFSEEQYAQMAERQANPTPPRWGPQHQNWKESPTTNSGRGRARRRFELKPCEQCGKDGTERHHKDGNTLNNEPSNIEILCRRCHMEEDGRLERFIAIAKSPRVIKPPRVCVTCGRLYKPLRRGECSRCADRRRYPNRQRKRKAA